MLQDGHRFSFRIYNISVAAPQALFHTQRRGTSIGLLTGIVGEQLTILSSN